MTKAVRLFLSLCLATLIASCSGHSESTLPNGAEVSSKTAPDGRSRAFVWAPKTSDVLGATNSQPLQVWLQYGKDSAQPSLVLKVDATDGVAISWKGSNELDICFGPTHVYFFNNLFDRADESLTLRSKTDGETWAF